MTRFYVSLRVAAILVHLARQAFGAFIGLIWDCLYGIGYIVASVWVGIPTSVARTARKWTEDAIRRGFDTRYSDYLYKCFWAMALLATLVGWIGYSYLTVWVVNGLLHRLLHP